MSTASCPFCLVTFIFSLVLLSLRRLVIVQVKTVPSPPSTSFGHARWTLWPLRRSLLMLATPWLTSVFSPPQPAVMTTDAIATASPPRRHQALYLTGRPPHSLA